VSYYKTIIIAEKSMGGTLSYKKFRLARAMVPEHFLPAYSRMLHLMKKKRIRDGHLKTLQTYR